MAKKLNEDAIKNELRSGSVFFRPTSPDEQSSPSQPDRSNEVASTTSSLPRSTEESISNNITNTQVVQQTHNTTSNTASNITILQFISDEDIEQLREPAYQVQSFRLTYSEMEWVKDTAYKLNKKAKRGKVTQADIVRLSFKLFEKLVENNESELQSVLERIK